MKTNKKELDPKVILVNNLRRYLQLSGKNQKEVAFAIGVQPSTFCDWMNLRAYPRPEKVQALADYFGIKKADLVDELPDDEDELDDRKILELFHQIPKEKRAEAIALCESVLGTFSKF